MLARSGPLLLLCFLTTIPVACAQDDEAGRLRAALADGRLARARVEAAAGLGHLPACAALGLEARGPTDKRARRAAWQAALEAAGPEGPARIGLAALRRSAELDPSEASREVLGAAERHVAAPTDATRAALARAVEADSAATLQLVEEALARAEAEGIASIASAHTLLTLRTTARDARRAACMAITSPTADHANRATGPLGTLEAFHLDEPRLPPPPPAVAAALGEALAAGGHGRVTQTPELIAFREELARVESERKEIVAARVMAVVRDGLVPLLLTPAR